MATHDAMLAELRRAEETREMLYVVEQAIALIRDRSNWTTHALARTVFGVTCDWNSRAARKFCANGAIHRAALLQTRSLYKANALGRKVTSYIENHATTGEALKAINDDRYRGHDRIMKIFEYTRVRLAA